MSEKLREQASYLANEVERQAARAAALRAGGDPSWSCAASAVVDAARAIDALVRNGLAGEARRIAAAAAAAQYMALSSDEDLCGRDEGAVLLAEMTDAFLAAVSSREGAERAPFGAWIED